MVDIKNGESEIATVSLSIPDFGKEIKNWSEYSISSNYLEPCDTWQFVISAEDVTLYQELLVPGAKVTAKINGLSQFTGYIDNRSINYAPGKGTTVSIAGRDILSRLTNANASPKLKLKKDMTVLDLLGKFVNLYQLGKVYNSEGTNLNVLTGRKNKESLSFKTTTFQEITYEKNADGSLKTGDDGKYISTLQGNQITEVISNKRPELKNIKIKELKPHPGEGAYDFLSRMLRRIGLILKAAADGSGILVSAPNFEGELYGDIICKKGDTSKNNVKESRAILNWASQPTVIIAEGFGGGPEFGKSKIQVIMVNELTGLDANGNPVSEIQDIKASYPNAFIVPIRKELVPKVQVLGSKYSFCPMYIKDDESKTIDELKFAVLRKMAECQRKVLNLSYTLVGFTNSKGEPWAVNTLVNVDDDIHGIHEKMWVLGRTFNKSVKGGTSTTLQLIRPYTLIISDK